MKEATKKHVEQPKTKPFYLTQWFWFAIGAMAVLLALRFWNLDHRIIFDWDQERDAKQLYDIVVNHHFTLIGQRTTSDLGFFLAPYFTYLLIPFYLGAGMHPWGLLALVVTYNIIFAGTAFFVLRKLFGIPQALGFLFLWAVNTQMMAYDIIPWPPLLVPLGQLLVVLLLSRIVAHNKKLDWVLLGATLGFFVNMHFQFVFMILFSAFVLIYDAVVTKPGWKPFIFNSILAKVTFIAMFAPLFLFDLRHNFMNSKLFIGFFFGGGISDRPKDIFGWIPVLVNFFQPVTIVKNAAITLTLYALMLVVFVALLRKSDGFIKRFYAASIGLWAVTPLFFIAYGQRPSEYYFIYLLPIVFIALADVFNRIKMIPLLVALAGVLAILNMPVIKEQLATEPFGLFNKQKTVEYLHTNFADKKYNVSFDVEPGREPGFRYLLQHYDIKTHDIGSPKDPLIEVRIPPQVGDVTITDDIGLKIPDTLK